MNNHINFVRNMLYLGVGIILALWVSGCSLPSSVPLSLDDARGTSVYETMEVICGVGNVAPTQTDRATGCIIEPTQTPHIVVVTATSEPTSEPMLLPQNLILRRDAYCYQDSSHNWNDIHVVGLIDKGERVDEHYVDNDNRRIMVGIANSVSCWLPYDAFVEDPLYTPEGFVIPTETALICPPDNFSDIAVGYLPFFGGYKKDAVNVSVDCQIISITFANGYYLTGWIGDEGRSLITCTLHADKDYPCSLFLQNIDNYRGEFTKPNGRTEIICLALSNKDYNTFCGG